MIFNAGFFTDFGISHYTPGYSSGYLPDENVAAIAGTDQNRRPFVSRLALGR